MRNEPIGFMESEASKVDIYVAGDFERASSILQDYALDGACFSLSRTRYVYTGGFEEGVIVGLINYPRYSCSREDLFHKALNVAELLIKGLAQGSATVNEIGGRCVLLTRRRDHKETGK